MSSQPGAQNNFINISYDQEIFDNDSDMKLNIDSKTSENSKRLQLQKLRQIQQDEEDLVSGYIRIYSLVLHMEIPQDIIQTLTLYYFVLDRWNT